MNVYYYHRVPATEEAESVTAMTSQAQWPAACTEAVGGDNVSVLTDLAAEWCVPFEQRPAARKLLGSMNEGDKVIIDTLAAMFSSIEDMEQSLRRFREKDVALHVSELGCRITDEDLSLPFRTLLRSFARLEKRRSCEKMKATKQRERRKGRFLGGNRPFGYTVHSNGRLIENPMEQRVLRKILSLKEQGCSLRKISATVSTPMTPVSFKTVQRIIQRYQESLPTL